MTGLIGLTLLAGCNTVDLDPPPPADGTTLVVPPLPGEAPPDARGPGVYLVVVPTWSDADYRRIRDEVFDEVGPDGFQAFLLDEVHGLAELIAAEARESGYPRPR